MIQRKGFSLIELTAVLMLLALVCGVVSMAVAQRLDQARQQDAMVRVIQLDVDARQHALRYGKRCEMTWSAYENLLTVTELDSQEIVGRCRLPEGWIVKLLDPVEDQEQAEIYFEATGITPCYAIELQPPPETPEAPAPEDSSLTTLENKTPRVLFAGLTGHAKRCDDLGDYQRYAKLVSGDDTD